MIDSVTLMKHNYQETFLRICAIKSLWNSKGMKINKFSNYLRENYPAYFLLSIIGFMFSTLTVKSCKIYCKYRMFSDSNLKSQNFQQIPELFPTLINIF